MGTNYLSHVPSGWAWTVLKGTTKVRSGSASNEHQAKIAANKAIKELEAQDKKKAQDAKKKS